MVEYDEDRKHAYFNGYKFTRDEKKGYYLSSKNLKNNKRQRLHVYMWEYYNGEIKEGYTVHHKDKDKNNNEMSNFILLLGLKYSKLQRAKYSQDEKWLERTNVNMQQNDMFKTMDWHATDEGRKWNSKHGKKCLIDRKLIKYVCDNCGKTFESINIYSNNMNKFCSNNCKATWRRGQVSDNENRVNYSL